jgi:hypothetical protein
MLPDLGLLLADWSCDTGVLNCRDLSAVRLLREVVLAGAAFGRLEARMLLLQARAP